MQSRAIRAGVAVALACFTMSAFADPVPAGWQASQDPRLPVESGWFNPPAPTAH